MNEAPITDEDRYPTLSECGREMLRFLREHPHAPIYRNESGNRLQPDDLVALRELEREVEAIGNAVPIQGEPPWLGGHLERCYEQVPYYRRLGAAPLSLADVPPVGRGDLARDIAQFVPDDLPLERLINFNTTGTTGHPLLIPSHPRVAASYLVFHRKALKRVGINLLHEAGQVGVVLVGYQKVCFTYVSVTPLLNESGLAKINLHPADWRDIDDRAKYLDALAPEVFTGDPISLRELATLPLKTRPRAILSTSMMLMPELRRQLENQFGCPVLDIYSLNEAGPVAIADEKMGGHVLLQHRMHVEILDEAGRNLPLGTRGEVVLTGGFNPYLPLLRYRTGDQAALVAQDRELILVGLEGRPPVMFRTTDGTWINNIEVTHALRHLPLAQFKVHQTADGGLDVKVEADPSVQAAVREALLGLFGAGQGISVTTMRPSGDKVIQYTSDLPGGPG